MILIQLVGGPDDGLQLKIAKHRYEWLIPRATPWPITTHEVINDEPARMYVSVYRKIAGSNRYRFHEVRQN